MVRRIRADRLRHACANSSSGTLAVAARDLDRDLEKAPGPAPPEPEKDPQAQPGRVVAVPGMEDIKLSLKDVNPVTPLWQILRRLNNLVILVGSGLIFAFGYFISYTCARSLASKYNYNALQIG